MTIQLSTNAMNWMLDAYEIFANGGTQGTNGAGLPVFKLWGGTKPVNCAAADASPSTLTAATITVAAADFMAAASGGSKAFTLPLQDLTADNTVNPVTHYRLYLSGGTTCFEQGTVTATGGGGDMTIDNVSVTAGQQINITGWTKNFSAHV